MAFAGLASEAQGESDQMGVSGQVTRAAVFLDRDGVINRAIVRDGMPFPPKDISELEVLPGVPAALSTLHDAGFLLIVVTNQPDVSRGKIKQSVVEEINRYLTAILPIDEFSTCYHDNADHCDCRKPRPGALIAASEKHGINLAISYMVGDRWRDTEAGRNAGCKTIFIDYGYSEKQPEIVDHRVQSLAEAVPIILRTSNEKIRRTESQDFR